jgi:putative DNA primase/helicase
VARSSRGGGQGGGGGPPRGLSGVNAPAWWSSLVLNSKGNAQAVSLNGTIALDQDPAFAMAIRLDKFRNQTMVCAPLPWDPNTIIPRPWTGNDDFRAMLWLQEQGIMLRSSAVSEIVEGIAARYAYHPVMDYFDNLGGLSRPTNIWDGTPRIDKWLTYYLGVPDTDYTRAVGPRWLISCIARVFEPGVQADSVLVLEGKTGIGKSSTFKILGGPFYSNDIKALSHKDAQEQIIGVWIMELDELDAVRRASDWTGVISFVSRGTDRFRFSYGRRVQTWPRQCVFGGTTERDTWQPELIGIRRWWPVKCSKIDRDALAHDRDQLWAEALLRYAAGEKHWLHEDNLIRDATVEQMARAEADPWDDLVMPVILKAEPISTTKILTETLKVPSDRLSKADTMRVASILRRHYWERRFMQVTDPDGKKEQKWMFVPPDPKQPQVRGGGIYATICHLLCHLFPYISYTYPPMPPAASYICNENKKPHIL